jgi:hypothetical protein
MRKIIITLFLVTIFFSSKTEALPVSAVNIPVSVIRDPVPRPGISHLADGKKMRLSFVERIVYKMMAKKIRKTIAKAEDGKIDADKLARQANLLGWLSLGAFLIFPLATIPLAIIAIINGTTALENHTTLVQQAKTGRTVGIISLSMVVALIFIVILVIAGFVFP